MRKQGLPSKVLSWQVPHYCCSTTSQFFPPKLSQNFPRDVFIWNLNFEFPAKKLTCWWRLHRWSSQVRRKSGESTNPVEILYNNSLCLSGSHSDSFIFWESLITLNILFTISSTCSLQRVSFIGMRSHKSLRRCCHMMVHMMYNHHLRRLFLAEIIREIW